jgi:hypothetical protein
MGRREEYKPPMSLKDADEEGKEGLIGWLSFRGVIGG